MAFAAQALVIYGLIILALVPRLDYLVEARTDPVAYPYWIPDSDQKLFYEWGRTITKGDISGLLLLHPLHDLHVDVARKYVEYIEGQDRDFTMTEAKRIWDHLYGGRRFHQEPLYPYILTAIYKSRETNPIWMQLLQFCLSIVTTLLIYFLTLQLFGETTALVAALISILCGPLLLHETTLLRVNLLKPLMAGLALALILACNGNSHKLWVLCGLLAGLAILATASFLLLLLIAQVTWLLVGPAKVTNRNKISLRGIAPMMIFYAIFIFTLSPLVLRNVSDGVAPFSLSSVGSITFGCSNSPGYRPETALNCDVDTTAEMMGNQKGDCSIPF